MKERTFRWPDSAILLTIVLCMNCAGQDFLSGGIINQDNYQQIAALILAASRLPEEAALAGYFTAHEDPMVHCAAGDKVIHFSGSKRVGVSYEACGFEIITWNGTIEQPVDQNQLPYEIVFGHSGDPFGFFQTDSTFFAPFIEQVGFAFSGDFIVDHQGQKDIYSSTTLDIHVFDDEFDDLFTFRNMSVNRFYDAVQGRYAFTIIAEISSDLLPTVDCQVTNRFQRFEDRYPFQGELSIVAVNDDSQVVMEIISDGNQVVLKLDSDRDGVFETRQMVSWEEIKGLLPATYQALFSYYWHS